jgi:RNA polymerase sigma-70 factor (ECF subfamily)
MFLQFQKSSAADKDESLLWDKMREGEREALNSLFRRYYRCLLSYGINLVSDRELVRDGIQKLFLKLWNKRQSLSTPQSVKGYLYVSLRRILLAQVKSRRAREKRNKSYMELLFKDSGNIEDTIIDGETASSVKQYVAEAIQSLPPRQKEALYLRFHDGLTNKEIAEIMDIAYQSVRNHISKAIREIRRHAPDTCCLPKL